MSQRFNAPTLALGMSMMSRNCDAAFQWGNAASVHLMLPSLRAFWPMSSRDIANSAYDLSGQANTAAQVGAALTFDSAVLSPYVLFSATNNLNAGAGAGTSLANDLTLGGWFYFDAVSGGASEFLIGRSTDAAGGRQYWIRRNAAGTISFIVSVDGTATTIVTSSIVPAIETWYFIAARYNPSTEIKLWVDDNEYSNTTAIPAALFTSGLVSFTIGATSTAGQRWAGRASMCWLSDIDMDDVILFALYEHTRCMFKKSVV